MAKADKRRAKAERAMYDAKFTPAQRLMREEMVRGTHPPVKLSGVLDETFGADLDITELALKVIEDAPNLTLSFSQWITVQGMVEDAIRAGMAAERGQG